MKTINTIGCSKISKFAEEIETEARKRGYEPEEEEEGGELVETIVERIYGKVKVPKSDELEFKVKDILGDAFP